MPKISLFNLRSRRNCFAVHWIMIGLVLALIGGCMPPPEQTSSSTTDAQELRYLALGDSYTIGESVTEDQRWPVLLAERLQAGGQSTAAPEIIARTGWTTDELQAAIQNTDPQGPYDLVSLLIGVNNQYRGYDLETYRQELRQLIEQSIALAGGRPGRVIVLSIPDWGVTPFAGSRDREQIAREIDAFNAVKQEEARAAGVRFVDITPISRQAVDNPALIAADGLHPSGEMYRQWVELIFPVVSEMLADDSR